MLHSQRKLVSYPQPVNTAPIVNAFNGSMTEAEIAEIMHKAVGLNGRLPVNQPKPPATTVPKRIYRMVKKYPGSQSAEIAKRLRLSQATVRRELCDLRKVGRADFTRHYEGGKTTCRWSVTDD